MGKGLTIGIIIVAIIVVLILIFSIGNFGSKETTTLPEIEEDEIGPGIGTPPDVLNPTEPTQPPQQPTAPQPQTHTVEISSSGFSPSPLTINAGDTVRFLAVDNSNRWPASAFHPTHTAYPGSNINKCGTAEESMIFDSCKGIPNGQSFSFTFTEIGTWYYHDHLSTSKTGAIIVQ